METIGLLLPRSTYYQTIGFDIFQGLKASLKKSGREDIKIVTENIGFGAEKQQCYRSAERLLLEENASLVIAYIGHRTAELLKPLFQATNKILIVLDAGAHLPQEWPTCPNIFYHSLHNSLGAWLSSKNAANNGHQNGGLITGYYDGGYLHTYSASKGFEEFGGTISFNHATGYKKEDFSMEPLKNHVQNFPNSAFLSLFSGDYVQWYFEDLKNNLNNNDYTIYMSPFGFEETMLKEAVHPGSNIKGVACWSSNLTNNENHEFIKSMEGLGKIPNLFSLLGWESTTIALKTLELIKEHKNNTAEIASKLLEFEFESPRGTTSFNQKTNTSLSPLYHASIIENDNGTCDVELHGAIENLKEEFENLINLPTENCTSAWYNSYTCI
ncbi:ABC transporter substrate-binding protein [Flavobacterium sp. SM15]|uniref:ABC transporter substrate-binding protein n=1 Tax=Flavobacterium sp. SM15 TaxID=2908005 RepID=UPI001EDA3B0E|nr:ABC transporter substrate-binding protein [Flavobacterium sp. SM15]MCG2612572.1 ABC transporter substrate-binding protein [Flavobacterium sp. SM15]